MLRVPPILNIGIRPLTFHERLLNSRQGKVNEEVRS
jgi:hypothetical protein